MHPSKVTKSHSFSIILYLYRGFKWWPRAESNHRHADFQYLAHRWNVDVKRQRQALA